MLDPVIEIATTGRTQADRAVEIHAQTRGDVAKMIQALAHPGLHP
jgi:hypothetical protein